MCTHSQLISARGYHIILQLNQEKTLQSASITLSMSMSCLDESHSLARGPVQCRQSWLTYDHGKNDTISSCLQRFGL